MKRKETVEGGGPDIVIDFDGHDVADSRLPRLRQRIRSRESRSSESASVTINLNVLV